MSSNPHALVARVIEDLETLTAILNERIDGPTEDALRAVKARTCKEARLTISVLLPKLHAVRAAEELLQRPRPACVNCDD